jgi:hypothetical protein
MTMTYDQSRSPPPQGPPGIYEKNDSRYSQVSSSQPSNSNQPVAELDRHHTRGKPNVQQTTFDADATGYIQVRQPINEAVASGIDATNIINTLPPEVISQLTSQITASVTASVTANVLQQLKEQSIAVSTNPQAPPAATTMPASPATTGSPLMDRSSAKTPPSPYRAAEEIAQTPTSPTLLHPFYAQGSPPQPRRELSPFSSTSQADESEQVDDRATRPRGLRRISTGGDATIIEKTWGALFTGDGQPTARLGQFLRGIAIHIIEDYEPKHSLVITPSKLQKYYQDTKLSTELYLWNIVFDHKESSISRLFREFEAQHHLVQDRLDKKPSIPGLTPHGFEKWVTVLLYAHPDHEFERLAKTALHMPISNPDNRRERFPKEISRRLFPRESNAGMVSKLQNAINVHCGVDVRPRQDSTVMESDQQPHTSYRADDPVQPPPIKPRRQDSLLSPVTPPPIYLGIDRGRRKSYSNAPSDAAISEDDDDAPTPQPIERERKPYVAQPGGGKNYGDIDRSTTEFVTPEVRPGRATSMSQGQPPENFRSRPTPIVIQQRPPPLVVDGSEVRHTRSNSIYSRDAQGRVVHQRSPSANVNGKEYGHRSEGDVTYGSSYPTTTPNDVKEDTRRYREFESQRERHATDQYDPTRMTTIDPRDREKDPRSKMQPATSSDSSRSQYANEDEYYRAHGRSRPTNPQYPPSSHR